MILKKKEIRKLALLKQLVDKQTPLSKNSILGTFNISWPVLNRDIQSLNDDFKTIKEFSTIELLTEEQSLYLKNPTPFNLQFITKKVRLTYYLQSIQYNLFTTLFSHSGASLTLLAKKLAISLPYLYKLLLEANQFLAPFSIQIAYSKNLDNILVTGSNANIRLFKTYFFWDITQGIEWPFDNVTSEEIFAAIPQTEIQSFLNSSISKQSKYLYSLATSHQLFPVSQFDLILTTDFRQTMQVYQAHKDLSQPLARLLRHAFSAPAHNRVQSEQLFLNFSVRVFSSYRDDLTTQNAIGQDLYLLDNPLIDYCKKLMTELVIKFPEIKQLDTYDEIRHTCIYFLALFFANVFYFRFDPASYQDYTEFNTNNSSFDSVAFELSQVFFNKFIQDFPLTDEANQAFLTSQKQNAYVLIYTIISTFKISPLKICVYFSKNLFEEAYIQSELLNLFGKENIMIVDNLNDANLIISDFYEARYQSENVFYFDDITSQENWQDLYTFIHNYQLHN